MYGEKSGLKQILKIGPTPAFKANKIISGLLFRAKTEGVEGNSITVTIANTGADPVEVSVSGNDITINVDTTKHNIKNVKNAVDASVDAKALVDVTYQVDFETSIEAATATNLEQGYAARTGYNSLVGVRESGLSISAESVDGTHFNSDNWKEIIGGAGLRSASMSISGVVNKDDNYKAIERAVLEGIVFPIIYVDTVEKRKFKFSGKISSFELSSPSGDAFTFSGTVESSGPIVIESATDSEADPTI